MKINAQYVVIAILLLTTGFLLGFIAHSAPSNHVEKQSAIKPPDNSKYPPMNLRMFDSLVTTNMLMTKLDTHGYESYLSIYDYAINFSTHTVRHIKSIAGAIVLIGSIDKNCITMRKCTAYDIHGTQNTFSDRFSTSSHKLDSLKQEGYYFYYRIKAVTFDDNTSIIDQSFN